MHNPVAGYRVLLDEPGGYRWLNGRGLHERDVPDAGDFRLTVHDPAPAWMDTSVVYQVFPDRFARSGRQTGRASRTGRCRPRGTTSRSLTVPASRSSSSAATCPASSSGSTTCSASASTPST